jgi:hypothetical protein
MNSLNSTTPALAGECGRLRKPQAGPVFKPTDQHVFYRPWLHAAFAERRLARPAANEAAHGSVEDDAANLVIKFSYSLADEVLRLPAPSTLDGLGVVGLAMAIQCEGMASLEDGAEFPDDDRLVAVARAILAVTREPLPADWGGWGNEPGYFDREVDYLESGIGTLPAWALAKAREARA